MSMKLEGKICPVCHAYFFDDEDIVFCPTCGLPHHRDCYKSLGHCAQEHLHGTDMQYDVLSKKQAEKTETEQTEKQNAEPVNNQDNSTFAPRVRCGACGSIYSIADESCANCGAKNPLYGRVMPYDLLGGVKPDEPVAENIVAKEAAAFAGVSTNKLIPKFLKFFRGKKASFSVWGFLLPTAHFAGRKMSVAALISGAIEVCAKLLMMPFSNELMNMEFSTTAQMFEYVNGLISSGGNRLLFMALIGSAVYAALHIFCGIFSDYWYYKHATGVIKETKSDTDVNAPNLQEVCLKKGGINIFTFAFSLILTTNLPTIIASFILL